MIRVLAIAQREIHERAFVFLAAAGVAIAPFIALVVPSGSFSDRMSATMLFGHGLAISFLLGLGVLLGTSLIGREAREKRLSFYFARPVSGSAIWFGKVVAAAAMIVVSAAIVFAPNIFLLPSDWRGLWDLSILQSVRLFVIFACALVLVFHVLSSIIRSRSLLILVDFVALIAFVTALWSALLPVAMQRPGWRLTLLLIELIGGVMALVLLLAGAWQLSRGRIDARRAHRELSISLWSGLALVLAATGAGSVWLVSSSPADLANFSPEALGSSAVVVYGQPKHRLDIDAAFLMNADNGAWQQVTPAFAYNGHVNEAGTVAVGFAPPAPITTLLHLIARQGPEEITLQAWRLRGSQWQSGKPIAVPYRAGEGFASELSPDGNRLAVVSARTLSVVNVADGRVMGSARIRCQGWVRIAFAGPGAVILTASPWSVKFRPEDRTAGEFVAYRYDIAQRSLRTLVSSPLPPNGTARAELSADGRVLAVRQFDEGREVAQMRLFNSSSGALMGEFTPAGHKPNSWWLLNDGTTVVAEDNGPRVVLGFYSSSGVRMAAINLARSGRVREIAEATDGRLVVSFAKTFGAPPQVLVVDRSTGAVTKTTTGTLLTHENQSLQRMTPAKSFVLFDNGQLVRWQALTGVRKVLLALR